jgi:uncharacterized membrane-anchored protein
MPYAYAFLPFRDDMQSSKEVISCLANVFEKWYELNRDVAIKEIASHRKSSKSWLYALAVGIFDLFK